MDNYREPKIRCDPYFGHLSKKIMLYKLNYQRIINYSVDTKYFALIVDILVYIIPLHRQGFRIPAWLMR